MVVNCNCKGLSQYWPSFCWQHSSHWPLLWDFVAPRKATKINHLFLKTSIVILSLDFTMDPRMLSFRPPQHTGFYHGPTNAFIQTSPTHWILPWTHECLHSDLPLTLSTKWGIFSHAHVRFGNFHIGQLLREIYTAIFVLSTFRSTGYHLQWEANSNNLTFLVNFIGIIIICHNIIRIK